MCTKKNETYNAFVVSLSKSQIDQENSTCTQNNASEVSPEQCKDQLYAGGHYIQDVVTKSRFYDILSLKAAH